jgi:hypothetical protein
MLRLLILVTACFLAGGAAAEQLPDHPGKWHPWSEQHPENIPARMRSSPELKVAMAQTDRIQAVFARAKPLDPPLGVNVLRSRTFEPEGFPHSYYVLMILKDLSRKCPTCRVEEAPAGPGFHVYVNTLGPLVPQNGVWNREYIEGVKIFPEPRLAAEKELGGFPLYQGDFSHKWVVIARRGRPAIWKPVSTERALTLLIEGRQAKVDWERKRVKTAGDEMRLGFDVKMLDALKNELATMSAEERARQAWSGCKVTATTLQERPSFLCRGAPPGERAVKYVELSSDYWDASLPATRPQVIILDVMMRDDRKRPWRHALAKPVVDALDWKALGEMVNPRD